ncbi:hypothetical protein LOK49_LG04G01212 [Camellia lanceoleosa]|uniref:Uncharacterized protein n=2 Tax=Camellia lanceoleosa TaxID=1840588 RepID=A0ACC0I5D7_9ERIC|nr:hypothetical protein LOK49_LG04G01207 [Camellia lanceoleosa]KAI8020173.1 hypothetical protein LOK49_LG04G01212 [Camellia lanceoleosa]
MEIVEASSYEALPLLSLNHVSLLVRSVTTSCRDVGLVKKRLEEMGMRYVTAVVEEEGIQVDQVFFHDPDGYMVELCNCENIPIIPISSCSFKPKHGNNNYKKMEATKCGLMETFMMETLSMDMMNFSF